MARLFIFADEAGDFDFRRHHKASQHFILCTVAMDSCDLGNALLALRRELVWKRLPVGDYFHCTTDKQPVRDEVFWLIRKHDSSVQATIMEKAKAQPHVRKTRARFYQYGRYYHFTHGIPPEIKGNSSALITAASIGTKKEKLSFHNAIDDVMTQTLRVRYVTDFRPCAADPCLQVADYCAWAIQRKWERNDSKSYDLIRDRITYEYDLWRRGPRLYY